MLLEWGPFGARQDDECFKNEARQEGGGKEQCFGEAKRSLPSVRPSVCLYLRSSVRLYLRSFVFSKSLQNFLREWRKT